MGRGIRQAAATYRRRLLVGAETGNGDRYGGAIRQAPDGATSGRHAQGWRWLRIGWVERALVRYHRQASWSSFRAAAQRATFIGFPAARRRA